MVITWKKVVMLLSTIVINELKLYHCFSPGWVLTVIFELLENISHKASFYNL